MLKFSIESINSRSPYHVQESGEGLFSFTTDESLVYEVGFVRDYMLYFASVILRNDNPHYHEYMEAINKFEVEMAEKLKQP